MFSGFCVPKIIKISSSLAELHKNDDRVAFFLRQTRCTMEIKVLNSHQQQVFLLECHPTITKWNSISDSRQVYELFSFLKQLYLLYFTMSHHDHFAKYTVRQKKRIIFLLGINLLIRNVMWQKIVLLLLVSIIIDVTYLISGIYTDFHRLLCKKCDVGYYVNNHG